MQTQVINKFIVNFFICCNLFISMMDIITYVIKRYKIYVEGGAWSVSEKYILACDAMTLLIIPEFYDFFVRGMQPMQHYWPIRPDNKCRDIKFAVDWGNTHPWEVCYSRNAIEKFFIL